MRFIGRIFGVVVFCMLLVGTLLSVTSNAAPQSPVVAIDVYGVAVFDACPQAQFHLFGPQLAQKKSNAPCQILTGSQPFTLYTLDQQNTKKVFLRRARIQCQITGVGTSWGTSASTEQILPLAQCCVLCNFDQKFMSANNKLPACGKTIPICQKKDAATSKQRLSADNT